MPGSFDKELTIDEHGCLKPRGPLELAEGEEVLRLDIWVFQDRAACMDFLLGPEGGQLFVQGQRADRWTMNPDPHDDHFGEMFQPGAATGMGLMVSRRAGQTRAFQWTEEILLVGGKGGPDHDH
jgi:hypothetical protein